VSLAFYSKLYEIAFGINRVNTAFQEKKGCTSGTIY
jgi:hypothetical protein